MRRRGRRAGGLPTLILFENGEVRDRITGVVDAARMRRWIEPHLAAARPI
jgi:thioredoxin-like negative regulator of GroEL